MRHITITSETIAELCKKLTEQLTGTCVNKDTFTITVPTKLSVDDVDKPTVIVSEVAERKIHALVNQCDKEIAWNGTVSYDEGLNTYFIEDIFVFPQEVTASTATATDDYGPWLMQLDDTIFNKLRFHGHSHVNMGVGPSSIDLKFQEELLENVEDFYIFAIYNKKDDYNIWIYDKTKNLMFETKDIYYDSQAQDTMIWADTEIKNKVQSKPTIITNYASGYSNSYTFTPSKDNDNKGKEKGKGKGKNNKGAYAEYQQAVLKDIEARNNKFSSNYMCDGKCNTCNATCVYREY